MKKTMILFLFLTLSSNLLFAQEITVIPDGVLEAGDSALVTGDYVRVRSGPSLEHRILIKVNKGTRVSILARDQKIEKIGEMENYWYQIRISDTGLEGWMYGNFLEKNVPEVTEDTLTVESLPISPPSIKDQGGKVQISLKEIGSIAQGESIAISGDLNRNGISEILLLHKGEGRGHYSASGYEPTGGGFNEIYKIRFRNTSINNLEIFNHPSFAQPIIAAMGDNFTYLYNFDEKRHQLRLLYKLNTPLAACGELDGTNPYIVYLKKNKVTDNDGTVTYYIQGERIEYSGGRIRLAGRIEYEKPLPIKKLLIYNLDSDKGAEIIAEIGGTQFGGGVTVLKQSEGGLKRITNSGIPTFNNSPFVQMWGIERNGKPILCIYSTDPSRNSEVNTDFGFISAALQGSTIIVEEFNPVNRRLDEVNNGRQVIYFQNGDRGFPFLFLDFSRESDRGSGQDTDLYTVRKVILDS